MTALDELYGEGTTKRLIDALPGAPDVQQFEHETVRLLLTWGDAATMKIDCSRDEWNFVSLYVTPDEQRKGMYSACVAALEVFTRSIGVKRWRAYGADDESTKVLMKRGGWRRRGHSLTWKL